MIRKMVSKNPPSRMLLSRVQIFVSIFRMESISAIIAGCFKQDVALNRLQVILIFYEVRPTINVLMGAFYISCMRLCEEVPCFREAKHHTNNKFVHELICNPTYC